MEEDIDQSKKQVEFGVRFLGKSLKKFFQDIINLKEGLDIESTVKDIQQEIVFKGYNVWILICSIFIASIGLNTNSGAVVIGAMLISPLMGPILGVGLSVGTNDFQMLLKSLKNFAVMIAVSLITSTIYFFIFPSFENQSELLARTKPTTLDVFVAIFGGMAGIIAASRTEKSNVIPGVAIATALMPPLCTAGYGIASGNLQYFLGAMYLFLLNSIFICLSTYFFIKYFRFPLKSFVDPKKEKKVKRFIFAFVLIVIIPSGFLFLEVLRESYFKNKASLLVSENLHLDKSEIIKADYLYNDTLSRINIFLMGEPVSQEKIDDLNRRMEDYGLKNSLFVKNTIIKFHQPKDDSKELYGMINDLESKFFQNSYERNVELLKEKDETITQLQKEISKQQHKSFPYTQLENEIRINYPDIKQVGLSYIISKNSKNEIDTTFTAIISSNKRDTKQLSEWLKVRLKEDSVAVILR